MTSRPRIKINLTRFDKMLEVGGIILLLLMWGFAITNYFKSPEIVPTHYDLSGKANGFGNRIMLLFLPLIPTVLFLGLTQLNKFPHIYNYPTQITEENATRQYTRATKMIRFLKFAVVLIFTVDMLSALLLTTGLTKGIGIWFLPITIALLIIPVAIFIYKSLKK